MDMLLYVDSLWFFHIGFNFELDNYINNLPKETFYSIMTFKRHAVFVVTSDNVTLMLWKKMERKRRKNRSF